MPQMRSVRYRHQLPPHAHIHETEYVIGKRGKEVAAGVIDGPQSVVWRQSVNRLRTEEAFLLTLTRGVER